MVRASTDSLQLGWFVGSRPWWRATDFGDWVEDSYEFEVANFANVVLLSEDGESCDGVAIGRRAGRSDTFHKKVRFTDWISFEPFTVGDALVGLKGPTGRAANATRESQMGAFTQLASSHVLEWLRGLDGGAHESIDELVGRQRLPSWLSDGEADGYLAYSQQYDGLRVGLELAGFDRASALDLLPHPEEPDDLPLASLVEDQIVTNDVWTFLDWPSIPHVVSGATFEDPASGRRLRTFLANKLEVERQTGADIIYYLEDLQSFVLVQYKRCTRENNELRYRPDGQLAKELVRLNALQALATGTPAVSLADHRLGTPFCFMKLCEPEQPLGVAISKGKYFDLHGFDLSIATGPNGGKRIDYHDVDRYLTNTLFVELVAQGWVGSSGDVSEQVLKTLEASLKNDRSVLLASVRMGGAGRPRGPGSKQIDAFSMPASLVVPP